MLLDNQTMAQKQPVHAINWKVAAELPAIHGQPKALGLAGPLVGIHRNVVVVAGGANFPDGMPWLGGKKKYYDDIYVFEKEDQGNSIKPYPKIFHLPYPVAYGASCSTLQGIICAGGENANGITNRVLLVQWDMAGKNIAVKNLPDLPIAVTNASITTKDHRVYLAGGEMVNGVSNHLYSLDLNDTALGWKQLPSLPDPVSHAVMVVQSSGDRNGIYMIGGRKKNNNGISDLYASVYRYDLEDNQWQQKQSLPYALSAGTGMATGANSILLFGGDKGEAFHKTEQLIAAIHAEKDEAEKQQLIRQKAILQAAHPGFSKEVLQYNTIANAWEMVDTIPFEVPATTTAVTWGNRVLIPSGEIKAGVRTPQLLLGKFFYK
jgi:N-acetylneuraminate epimerase